MWLRCEFSSFHKKSIWSFFVYLCRTFIYFIVPAGCSFCAPLTLKRFNIRTDQQCFFFSLTPHIFSLPFITGHTHIRDALPASRFPLSRGHHPITPQYPSSSERMDPPAVFGFGRVIDLLLCLLMKETTFVLAGSSTLVLLNHCPLSVSICYH